MQLSIKFVKSRESILEQRGKVKGANSEHAGIIILKDAVMHLSLRRDGREGQILLGDTLDGLI